MTLTISNEIPENIRRGLLAKAEGKNWDDCSKIAKIRRYENNNTAYFLTTNALEDKKIKWIAKGKHFTHEGLDERVFGKDEELFIDGSGWVSQNGKHLMYGRTKKPIHIKNLVPELWTIKRRK